MHEKINAKIELNFPDDCDELLSSNILVGKNITTEEVFTSLVQYLANTDFIRTQRLYDFELETEHTQIDAWLKLAKTEHDKLSIEDPSYEDYLHVGTFTSDHKYAGSAGLFLVYERRYLENE